MDINTEGLKSIEEWLLEVDPNCDRNRSKLNKLLDGKIIWDNYNNRFWRVSGPSTGWNHEFAEYLYCIGYSHDYDKIINSKKIKTIRTSIGISGCNIYYNRAFILNEFKMTKKEQIEAKITSIVNEIESKGKELSYEQGKILYMNENKITEFDENEYKVYHALKTLDSTASTYDKAKLIAEIIKQK